MPFKKGNKFGVLGRPKGTPNKKSLYAREILESHGVNLIQLIFDKIQDMSPENQAKYLLELMPYVYPKLAAVQVSVNPEEVRPLKDVSDADLDAILIGHDKDEDHY